MVQISRFSIDGFVPKFQEEYVDFNKRKQIFANRPILAESTYIDTNCVEGVFAFIKGYEDVALLDHLTLEQQLSYSWYEADIEHNADIFEYGPPILKKNSVKIGDIYKNCPWCIFIPSSSIKKIKNIRYIKTGIKDYAFQGKTYIKY